MPESGPRAASSVSRTRSRSPDDSWGVDVNRTVDLESPSESSPSRCRMNRLLYLDLFLGTSYSGASYSYSGTYRFLASRSSSCCLYWEAKRWSLLLLIRPGDPPGGARLLELPSNPPLPVSGLIFNSP